MSKLVTKNQAVKPRHYKSFKRILKFEYPDDIDQELVPFLDVLGSIPGLRPLFSCCGHGREEFYLVLGCSAPFILSKVLSILGVKPKDISRIAQEGGSVKTRKNQFTVWVDLPSQHPSFCLTSYEHGIRIYGLKLGLMKSKERKVALKVLKDQFLGLVPQKHWPDHVKKVI